MVQEGAWVATCLDSPCAQVAFVSTTPGSGPDPFNLPCTSTREYRNVQEYLGACDGQPVSTVSLDGGSLRGKAGGAFCNSDGECVSNNCVATDGVTFVCADACEAGSCAGN